MNIIRTYLILLGLFACSAFQKIPAQGIKEIHLECDPDDFEYIYDNYQEDIYIPVVLHFQGTTWTDVMMRIRGDSSREYPKKSLKARFDGDPFENGRSVINFNAEYNDLSYMHSVLSSLLFNTVGIPCASMEHARLYLNNEFLGLYVMTENMDDEFLVGQGLDAVGTFYKASRDGACLSIFDNIFYHWDLKSGEDPARQALSSLIHQLNYTDDEAFRTFIQEEFNYDPLITFMALSILLSNGSTYYHNYFLFREPGSGQWNIFPWDLDRTFSDYSKWYPYHRSSGSWTPDNPIPERIIIDPSLRQALEEKLAFLVNSIFNSGYLFPVIDSLQSTIEASVAEDQTDSIPDLEAWETKLVEDKEFINSRPGLVNYQMSHLPEPFRIERSSGPFTPGFENEFNWDVSENPQGNNVSYKFYFSSDRNFQSPETIIISGIEENKILFELPSSKGKYYWTVKSVTGSLEIEGFDTYNEIYVSSEIEPIVINEINYNSDPSFDPGDWVEFYNPGGDLVDLTDWIFMDENEAHFFIFPQGTFVEAFDYLVLCRDSSLFNLHFPDSIQVVGDLDFGFSSNGDYLRLYNEIRYLVDDVPYSNDGYWPTEPDGEGPTLELMNPDLDNSLGNSWKPSFGNGTPGQKNSTFSPNEIQQQGIGSDFHGAVFPNPFRDHINIALHPLSAVCAEVKLIDATGTTLFHTVHHFKQGIALQIPTSRFPEGIYFIDLIIRDSDKYTVKAILQR